MQYKEVQFLIIVVPILFLVLIILMGALVNYIQKKKIQFILEQERTKSQYDEALLIAKVEIAERSMQHISWELHDNVGQLLSAASLRLKVLQSKNDIVGLKDLGELIGSSLVEIRSLSKTLNHEIVGEYSLKIALQNELERLERMNLLSTSLNVDSDIDLEKDKKIIIFRMIQEFISNTLKHAEAQSLSIQILRRFEFIKIIVKDDGKGFDQENVNSKSGLLNLQSRAKMIDASLKINSNIGVGTQMTISITNQIDNE